tara:strand:+ start:542 stop:1234 length:693 start_codon:yes stop_codon:yes gene_type:complete
MIELRDLSKKFDDLYVLKSVNWKFQESAISVILGPSGSGKTTLIRMMDLLEEPSSGSIYLDGVEVGASEAEKLEIRRKMALVPQRPVLFNDTVYNNISYPLRIRGETSRIVAEKVSWALELVGLKDYNLRKAWTLSGGEIQRVAIARALIIDPEVLFLDEPTNNLDVNAKSKMEDLILTVPKNIGSTVIMATHDIAQCQKLANDIIAIVSNQLVSVDGPEQAFYVFGSGT